MRTSSLILACLFTFLISQPLRSQIDYPDFSSVSGLAILGDAYQFGSILRLTPSLAGLKGGAWYETRQPVAKGFITTFRFRISETGGHRDPSGFDGGEGFAFVVQNSSSTVLGGSGATIGYHGIPNSLAIEFDTWNNSGYNGDPNHNHIGVHTRGRLDNDFNEKYSLKTVTSLPDMSDGNIHAVTVVYRADTLTVFLDDCARPVLSLPIDLDSLLDLDEGRAWLGFTATTASAWENHDILSWILRYDGIDTGDSVSICTGETLTLSAPPGYAEYQWSTGQRTRTVTISAQGDYTVTAVGSIGCANSPVTWTTHVSLLPKPKVMTEPEGSVMLCQGEERTVRAYSDDPNLHYRWSTDETTPEIIVREPGIYTVTATNSVGCSDTESIMVDLFPAPAPTISADGPLILCDGEEVTLTAENGYAAYEWSTGETTRSITVRDSGTYVVEVTDENGCRGVSAAVHVEHGLSRVPILGISDTLYLCPFERTTLDAGSDFASYRWSTGETTRSIVVQDSGRYWVTVSTAEGCSGTSDTVVVAIRPTPEPNIRASTPDICDDEGVRLTADDGFASYLWSTGETTQSITVREQGTYFVAVVDENGCRGTSVPTRIERIALPLPTIEIDGMARLCSDDSVTLTAPEGFLSYLWSTGARTRSITVHDVGSYRVTVTDTNGCTAVSEPVEVSAARLPVVDAGTDQKICLGGNASLNASVSGDTVPAGYQWTPSDGLDCTECAAPTASPTATTTYTVTIVTPDGCTASDSVVVTVDRMSGIIDALIPRDLHAAPGGSVVVPIIIDELPDGAAIQDLTITLDYDPALLQPSGVNVVGTGAERWNASVSTLPGSKGALTVRLAAPPNEKLRTVGIVLYVEFKAFLGSASESEIRFTITVPDAPCLEIRTSPGLVRIDSICGLALRLIEIGTEGYSLEPNRPNPFNPTTEIHFSIGLDGPARLEVFDANGNSVALLVDGYMKPGKYLVTWDASGYPSGMYYYRLTSGAWTGSNAMMLVK